MLDALHRRYGSGASFFLENIAFDNFLEFIVELFEIINHEFLWETYLQTEIYREKTFEDYKNEVEEKAKLSSMTAQELEAQALEVEKYINDFFKKGGSDEWN